MMKKHALIAIPLFLFTLVLRAQQDPNLWLEEVEGQKALAFVAEQNKITLDKLSKVREYQHIYDQCLDIYNATDRIETPSVHGNFVYNFWKDKDHVRGIWRRSPKAAYLAGNPAWETLLDLDAMSAKDNVKWVFKGADGLYPEYKRFLVSLSKGGADAVVIREFDADAKSFVENGFYVPEAKGSAAYLDENTVIVSSDFGAHTMTASGYPNNVKIWKRGTPLTAATLIHQGDTTDVGSWGYAMRDDKTTYAVIRREITFFSGHDYVWRNNQLTMVDVPEDANIRGVLQNQLIVDLKSDWTVDGKTYKQGAVVSLNFTDLLAGKKSIRQVLEPDAYSSVSEVAVTKNKLLVSMLNDVNGALHVYTFVGGNWNHTKVDAPAHGTISIVGTDEFSDQYFFQFENFLTPTTLFVANASDGTVKPLKSLTAYFDAGKYQVNQIKVKSKDGTEVPYFIVSAKGMKYDGTNPTLLYAYGGFEYSIKPSYSGVIGASWLENGGVFVLANIRGGGEYGPKWHLAGMKEKRQNVFDDFYAVAEDLIAKKVTSPSHLGIMGGSNGGLLMGVAFTQRPDLFNAVVCQVPLLDMQRYNKLLAGASWMGEYGNPDIPEEWAYIKKYSPYQNVKEGMKYPEVFFYTSTRDDRVHPGHARKMVAKMMSMGYPVYYYENTEGGHAGSSTNEQRAQSSAMTYSYLLLKLDTKDAGTGE
ncbi:MAG: S9 family peptidase [Flavobacteriales bacterium]|nr:S9 family peptidase [Flavobacteriales bacterium]